MRTMLATHFAFFLALAVGCSKPTPPTLTPEGVSLTRIDAQGIGLRLELTALNPNSTDLSVSEIASRIVLDRTHEVGTATIPGEILLPAGKATKVDVPVFIGWSDVGVLAQLAAGGGAVPYSVDGTLAMGGPLLHVGVPFHLDGSLSHEQMVNAAIHSLPWLPH